MSRSQKDDMIRWYSDLLTVNKSLPEAASEICDIWRRYLNAAGIRLWLYNKDFNEFDLLAHSCKKELLPIFLELTNRLPLDSIAGTAFKKQEIRRITSVKEETDFFHDPTGEALFNDLPVLICIPLISLERIDQHGGKEEMLGVLDIHFERLDQTELKDVDFQFLGSLSASALARGHAFDRKKVFEKLNTIALDLVVPDSDKLFATRKKEYFSFLKQIILEAVYANCASIFTADPGFETIRCCASTGIERVDDAPSAREQTGSRCPPTAIKAVDDEHLFEVVYRKGDGATWTVFEGNKPLNSKNIQNDPKIPEYRGKYKEIRKVQPKADSDPFLAVPMRGQKGNISTGVIRALERICQVDKRKLQNFSQYDVDMLMSIAGQVSPVFRLLSLHEHRQHYVARMAHQVIQPITGIVSYSSNLIDGVYQEPQEIMQKLGYIRAMSRSAARLTLGSEWAALARDFGFLKNIQRAERNLRQYILERILDMRPIREDDGIEMELTNSNEQMAQLGRFRCDELYFDQVVQNVLHNAVKYSYPGTEVKVFLTKNDRWLTVDVSSSGIPIEVNERDRIFSDMERGKWAHFLDPNGTGQGLSICRQIMNGFGGRIELLECKPSVINIHVPMKGLPPAYTSIFRISLPEAFK